MTEKDSKVIISTARLKNQLQCWVSNSFLWKSGQQNRKSRGEKASDNGGYDVSFTYTMPTRVQRMLPDWVMGLKITQQVYFKHHFQAVTKSNCINDYPHSHQIYLPLKVQLTPGSAWRSYVSERTNRTSEEKW